jgi:polyketide biosynthesis enoyl-CoA hydratase PksI
VAVLEQALSLAKELAKKPRQSLMILKNHLMKTVKNDLSDIIEMEESMHRQTIHQPEVLERIEALFQSKENI